MENTTFSRDGNSYCFICNSSILLEIGEGEKKKSFQIISSVYIYFCLFANNCFNQSFISRVIRNDQAQVLCSKCLNLYEPIPNLVEIYQYSKSTLENIMKKLSQEVEGKLQIIYIETFFQITCKIIINLDANPVSSAQNPVEDIGNKMSEEY